MMLGLWAMAACGTPPSSRMVCEEQYPMVETSAPTPDGGKIVTYTDAGGAVRVRGTQSADGMPQGAWTWFGPGVQETVQFEPEGQATFEPAWGKTIDLKSAGLTGRLEDSLEVLDVDLSSGWLAFRQRTGWEELISDGEKPADCQYPGMAAHRFQGVTLGVYNLDTHEVTTFEVYARPTPDLADCTPEPKAKAALEAAKKRFAELGLATDALPAAQKGTSGLWGQTFAGTPEIRITSTTDKGCFFLDPQSMALEQYQVGARGWIGSKPWFQTSMWYNPANAGSGSVAVLGVWRDGQQAMVGLIGDEFPAFRHWLFVRTPAP